MVYLKEMPKFDYATHYFRAFAILMVMACHSFMILGHEEINRIFFTSATHFFLFISGYLCQYLHDTRPTSAAVYYSKKLKNVLCPYVVFTVIYSFAAWPGGGLAAVPKHLAFGSAQGQLWYIPFVIPLFILSPLILKLKARHFSILLALSALAAIVFPTRQYPFTYAWPGYFHLYAYFTVYYLLGFAYQRYKTKSDAVIMKSATFIFALTLSLALLALIAYKRLGTPMVHLADEDLLISLQRLTLIPVMLYFFSKLKDKKHKVLDTLANCSFSLFFLNNIAFTLAKGCLPTVRPLIVDILVFPLVVALLTVFVLGLKKVLGKYSRMVIG